ncbi:hypothetical protein BHM03_00036050 [Ensete ventricosum]|nr:hypothetical protein BHM03_00036050 [Ensete ventricosum]
MVQVRIGEVKGITFPGFPTVEPPASDYCTAVAQVFKRLTTAEPPRVAPEAVVAIEQWATELEAEVVQKKSKLEESKRHLEESQQLLKESRYKFLPIEDQLLKLSWDIAEAWSKVGKVKEALAEETRAAPETTEGHRGVQGAVRVSDRNLEVGAGDV